MVTYRPKKHSEIRRNMAAIRSKHNRTEVALRKRLHAMGLRYRTYVKYLPGSPDIVFPRERIAIFVDGDFWHGRILIEEGIAALRKRIRKEDNRAYWISKFQSRVRRDSMVREQLIEAGWLVVRRWESDVKRDVEKEALRIARLVEKRRAQRNRNRSSRQSQARRSRR